MKKIIMASAIVLLSSFAHADEICGKVKKISPDSSPSDDVFTKKIEFSDGRSLALVDLQNSETPYIAASLAGDITLCFTPSEANYFPKKAYYQFHSASK